MKEAWLVAREGLVLLSRRGRVVIAAYTLLLTVLAALDAFALLLLASVFQTGVGSTAGAITIDTSATRIALIVILFTARSALSTVVTLFAVIQLAQEENRVSLEAFSRLLDTRTILSSSPTTDFQNTVERGPGGLMVLNLQLSTLVAEVTTGLVIVGALIVFQPLTALLAITYFLLVVLIQHKALSRRSQSYGHVVARLSGRIYELLADAAGLKRLLNQSSQSSLERGLQSDHLQLTRAKGMIGFLAAVPRYFLEFIFAFGLIVVGGFTYLTSGQTAALAATTLFIAAGFRLLPIVNRAQALLLSILSIAPVARLALARYPTVAPPTYGSPADDSLLIELSNVSFAYPNVSDPALKSVSLQITRGRQYAIVGASGSGKTTLVDLLLGLNVPQSGIVKRQPNVATAYVPQDTYVAAASLASNVALSWDHAAIDLEHVRATLRKVRLEEFVPRVDDPSPIGGGQISGGQRQRLGLARALFTDADFIVLDEVTSSLDVETERNIYEVIDSLRGKITVIIVAHRLATIQRVDEVFYLDDGQLLDTGTFTELSEKLPRFRRQIELSQIRLEA